MHHIDNRMWYSQSYQQLDPSIGYGDYYNYYDQNYYYPHQAPHQPYAPIIYPQNWEEMPTMPYPSMSTYGRPMSTASTTMLPMDPMRETSGHNTFQKEPNLKQWSRPPKSIGNRNATASYSYSHDDLWAMHGNNLPYTPFGAISPSVPYIAKPNMDPLYPRRPPKSAELFDPNASTPSSTLHPTNNNTKPNYDGEYISNPQEFMHVPRSPSHESFFSVTSQTQCNYHPSLMASRNSRSVQSIQNSFERLVIEENAESSNRQESNLTNEPISTCGNS